MAPARQRRVSLVDVDSIVGTRLVGFFLQRERTLQVEARKTDHADGCELFEIQHAIEALCWWQLGTRAIIADLYPILQPLSTKSTSRTSNTLQKVVRASREKA